MTVLRNSAFRAATLSWLLVTGNAFAAAPFHIGICTDPADQWVEPSLGAEQLVKEYGSVKEGGYIQVVTSPKDLVSMAKDPLLKVIVSCTTAEGVADAYKKIRVKRPELLLLASESGGDFAIRQSADLVIDMDPVSRGLTIPWGAKQIGASTVVFISFPRHLAMERIGRNKAVMEQACKDLGMTFAYEQAKDPRVDKDSAKLFIVENLPKWLQKYGSGDGKVAFYCTQDGLTYQVLKHVVANTNAVFVEEEYASPLTVDTDYFNLDPKADHYDFPNLLKQIEAAVATKGAAGRIGTTVRGGDFVFTAGLGEFGKRVVEGKAQVLNMEHLCEALAKFTPGSSWKGAFYQDAATGERTKNRAMLFTDTYVFGKGFLSSTSQSIPESYFRIKP